MNLKGDFVQTFGLDIRVVILAVMIDVMVGSIDLGSFMLFWFIELFAAVILAPITYKIQKDWYGDSHENALLKAAIIGLLTAIPGPFADFVAGPGGILGLIHAMRKKS